MAKRPPLPVDPDQPESPNFDIANLNRIVAMIQLQR